VMRPFVFQRYKKKVGTKFILGEQLNYLFTIVDDFLVEINLLGLIEICNFCQRLKNHLLTDFLTVLRAKNLRFFGL